MTRLLFLTIFILLYCKIGQSQCFSKVETEPKGTQMQFISDNIGYCNRTFGTFTPGQNSIIIYKTENAGETWEEYIFGDRSIYDRFYFVDENLGFIYGNYTIARTDDGGQTFTAPVQNNNYNFRDMFFSNRDLGWATSFPGNLWKTTDSGVTWNKIHDFPIGQRPSVADKLYFFNENRGFLLENRLLETNDGGLSWTDTGIWFPTDWQKIGNDLIILTEDDLITYNTSGQIINRKPHFFHPAGIQGSLTGLYRANFYLTETGKGFYTSTEGIFYTKDNGINWSEVYTDNSRDIFINSSGKGTLFSVENSDNYFYDCPLDQHSEDFYDRCYYAYNFDSQLNTIIKVSNDYSRLYSTSSDMFTVPKPSCWTSSTQIRRPFWLHFEGNNNQVRISLDKQDLDGIDNCKAALYKGDCHDLEIVDCGQIDFFSDNITFDFTAFDGIDYYIIVDAPGDFEFTGDLLINDGDSTTSIGEGKIQEYKIFPNPTSYKLSIPFEYSSYVIMSIDGKEVQSGFVQSENIIIDKLTSGLYIIRVYGKNGELLKTQKIQKI